ncbi:LemA family protein [Rhodohalobacter sulfatireducens]|uniref:LemA family protein n=1 Tax=Rhodohalobacter sulfatireducens TaxID=2911366 RepID=A0ABS9KAR8_9BACT|nr:LemA family protein [Rhodohalobacter sulfatireducens]MCG2587917.1 LemA family protein [Rhodohalobacter sulfatireducens]
MNIKVWIAIGVAVLLAFYGISVNNSLVEQEETVNQAWAQVENQYQRRADLVPNLVNTVQGAADFEQETLTNVIEARSRATSIKIDPSQLSNESTIRQFEQVQGQLGSALSRLLVSVERYPELTATQNFRDLQNQLEGTENRIATERMRFNQAAQQYNTSIRRFPASLFAGLLGFDRKYYFEATEGAENAPEVSFD